jgi:misacylated tRNA(Ala) deacylase
MVRYLCQDDPDVMSLETKVICLRPGAVLLEKTPAYPGGGGQLADKARICWSGGEVEITGFAAESRGIWHLFAANYNICGVVRVDVDSPFRGLMSELHTVSHIVNNLVYRSFGGALVTGVQMSGEGSFRIDFDLPGADNDRLRALEAGINDAIRDDYPVRQLYIPTADAENEPGIIRSKAVTPPPQEDGTVRIVDIVGLDRQACGGTHLASTGQARLFKILKIENKGRQNRRLRIGVADLFRNH